ncbi:hypothetical protein HPT29_018555 [Microvirga terrae]|uniref:Uncharacterized protein n=1 Tax=Microvirga terrae TaxID=2740529 RepID=A0ABY5RR99_9HYPH|nr:hypothetical protein [Microvirga terrae]UVF18474.1 hypothetical protein HPT29_018555 [Microvirga terrae]
MRYERYPLDPDWRPPARMMAEAPILNDWEILAEGEDLHLRGVVLNSKDPRFPDGAQLTTGVIQALDESEGWAIGYQGGYRLGAPRNGGYDA